MSGAKLGLLNLSDFDAQTRAALGDVDRVLVYQLPLINRFRRIDTRDGLLIRGPEGWAEISPFWDYDEAESATWMAAGIEAATHPAPPPLRQRVPLNATVPVVSPQRATEIVREAGCATVKVKVADPNSSLALDCERVAAVRDALTELDVKGAGGAAIPRRIRVDANAAWNPSEAVHAIKALDAAAGGLEYVEQPCASVTDLAWVRRHVSVPIAADESIRRASDPLAVARAEAADLIVVKVQPLGGARRVLEIISATGLPAVVSSALESSLGLMRSVQCAAALPQLDYACGLATSQLFVEDVTGARLLPQNGTVAVRPISPDESLLCDSAQIHALGKRWQQRLEAMTPFLEQVYTRIRYREKQESLHE